MELQQSPQYGRYIETLKWRVLRVDGVQMFYKKIPLMGGLLKIQRPAYLPSVSKLAKSVKDLSVSTVAIEPKLREDLALYKKWVRGVSKHYRVVRSVYQPTKTIVINLKPDEEEIFRRFTEAKRRAVRRAQKNDVTVRESGDIRELVRVKNKSSGFLGFITTIGIDKFWAGMYPENAIVLLAYHHDKAVGAILEVFWNKTAYYWVAGATRDGKKLFAPTLLVWEALKVAKKRGATGFDFLGVWDERMPTEHHDWKGFTKFKEGFGGTTLYYPVY